MKKLLSGALVLSLAVMTACSDKATEDEAQVQFVAPQELSDSVSIYYGKIVGTGVLSDYSRFQPETKSEQTKKDIVKGIQLIIGGNYSEGEIMGMQIAMAMQREMESMEEIGVTFDKNEVMKFLVANFMAEEVDGNIMREENQTFQRLMGSVEMQRDAFNDSIASLAPEAIEAKLAGKAFVDKIKATDPSVKTSESGLSYKIIEKGDTTVITDHTIVEINYVGKLIDGTVFDQSEEGKPARFSPAGVILGFGEGMKLLGKGGKATLYIPSELAYGVKGAGDAIGPNQTLIFDIEIVDIVNPR